MNNIVFYGGMGAGKSTAAEYLVDKHGYVRCPMAALLKKIAVELWGDGADMDRDKLQKLGLAAREIDPDVWLNSFLVRLPEGKPIVNDDVRFPNEYWGLKERGFFFVRVLSSEEKRVDRLLRTGKIQDISQLEHATETALTGLEATKEGIVDDYTIFNNGEPEELYNSIENVLTDIEERT